MEKKLTYASLGPIVAAAAATAITALCGHGVAALPCAMVVEVALHVMVVVTNFR
jgi:hypothetical protein